MSENSDKPMVLDTGKDENGTDRVHRYLHNGKLTQFERGGAPSLAEFLEAVAPDGFRPVSQLPQKDTKPDPKSGFYPVVLMPFAPENHDPIAALAAASKERAKSTTPATPGWKKPSRPSYLDSAGNIHDRSGRIVGKLPADTPAKANKVSPEEARAARLRLIRGGRK